MVSLTNIKVVDQFDSNNRKKPKHKELNTPIAMAERWQEQKINDFDENSLDTEDNDFENAKQRFLINTILNGLIKKKEHLKQEIINVELLQDSNSPNAEARIISIDTLSKKITFQENELRELHKRLSSFIKYLSNNGISYSYPEISDVSTSLESLPQIVKDVPLTFKDLAGCDSVLLEVWHLIMHIKHPDVYKTLGVSPPKGFLLYGPPGCGKTMLARAVAGELKIPLISLICPALLVSINGESENIVRKMFKNAVKEAPCVLFIDKVDSISPPRETTSCDMERRIFTQFLTSLNNLKDDDKVIVIGATNHPDSLDPALRRAGRFDREVYLGIPDKQSRIAMLELMCKNVLIDQTVSLDRLSELTPGYVGADLKSLTTEAVTIAAIRTLEAIKRRSQVISDDDETEQLLSSNKNQIKDTLKLLCSDSFIPIEDVSNIQIQLHDFEEALKKVVPLYKREGFVTVPDVTWDDIGSLKKIREELHMAMLAPVTYAKEFTALNLGVLTGVLCRVLCLFFRA